MPSLICISVVLIAELLTTATLVYAQTQAIESPPLPEFLVEKRTDDLPKMRERGLIRALVTRSLTDFFIVKGETFGLQADALKEYEKFLNAGRSSTEAPLPGVSISESCRRSFQQLGTQSVPRRRGRLARGSDRLIIARNIGAQRRNTILP